MTLYVAGVTRMYCEGVGSWITLTKRVKVLEEKDREGMLDCLSLGRCHLFK
jgi:hypothetical protein